MSQQYLDDKFNQSVELMILNTIESIIKINTKIAACMASKMTEDEMKCKLEGYDKKKMNLFFILYPSLEFARLVIKNKNEEYLHILDEVEKKCGGEPER